MDAARYLSVEPRPFLRWAGSKRVLLRHLVDLLPTHYRTYREPFLGGASLFFLLRPERAHLSDTCRELIDTFVAVRDNPAAVLKHLGKWPKPDRRVYYEILSRRSTGRFARAAEFIYLNKSCWNGLYRVNSNGEFNVPYGAPKTDFILSVSNLLACSHALRTSDVTITSQDFEDALIEAEEGDLVFLDPPYITSHNNNGFIDYNEKLFSWADQERLARVARSLADRGAYVLVANAFHRDVLELFPGFAIRELNRSSTLAAKSRFRGQVTEAVLWRAPRS